jgi:hypothetical protein
MTVTTEVTELPAHPAADLFPLLSPEELQELADDIRLNGLREPIWLYDDPDLGKVVLDGRNRLAACRMVGVEPATRRYFGDDPIGFVISYNLKRRHLSESQRAMVADRIAQLPAHRPGSVEISTLTQTEAADLLNVSRESVISARKVREQGVPELAEAVNTGQVAVSTAADIARAPVEEQRRRSPRPPPKSSAAPARSAWWRRPRRWPR